MSILIHSRKRPDLKLPRRLTHTIQSQSPTAHEADSQQPSRIANPGSPSKLYLTARKRLDQMVACLLLVICSPLLAIMIIAVRLTSSGPAIYRQTRVGRNGKLFDILKIRSMTTDAETTTGAVWSVPGDPRVTQIGRILRWTHLDELPQLMNIIRGDMALIGPRPERPEFTRSLMQSIPNYAERLEVLPGVTGLAQVTLPPDTDLASVQRKTLVDRQYVRTANPWLDLHILFCTVMMLFGLQKRLDAKDWRAFA